VHYRSDRGQPYESDTPLLPRDNRSLVVGNRRGGAVAPADCSTACTKSQSEQFVLAATDAPGASLAIAGRRHTLIIPSLSFVCSVFRHRPCVPYYLPPIGQDLRLTIVSTDENALQTEHQEADRVDKHPLDSISDMFAALRACWVPPPKEQAHHGMEYTIRFALKRDGTMIASPRMTYSSHEVSAETREVYRDAIDAALKRCTPLHLSGGMAAAIAGRPIAIRFVDDRS